MTDSPISQTEIYRTIGQRIRSERVKRHLKQDDLAKRLNLSRTSITNMEKGNQGILVHTLLELATILDVPASSFLLLFEQKRPVGLPETLPEKTRLWLEFLAGSTTDGAKAR